jgi:four helix bundle protein
MPTITRFEDLEAWQTARQLVNQVYDLSDDGIFARDFGLRDQIRRAAVSIMSNIAEGFESRTQTQFLHYLGIAKGSAGEVRAQMYVALDRHYISREAFDALFDLVDKCSRQMSRFMSYLERTPNSGRVREGKIEYDVSF